MRKRVTQSEWRDMLARRDAMRKEDNDIETARRQEWAKYIIENGLPLRSSLAADKLTRRMQRLHRSLYALEARIHDIEKDPTLIADREQSYMFEGEHS